MYSDFIQYFSQQKASYLFRFTTAVIFSLLLSGLSACSDNQVDAFWQGQWQRTVSVPNGMQGRCYNEVLSIDKRQWLLDVTIHSTFECDQAFLALQFNGNINEVLINKGNKEHKLALSIEDIKLTAMVDIAADSRVALSEDAVQRLSEQYVPEHYSRFVQNVSFNTSKTQMRASLYKAAEKIAIPEAIHLSRSLNYSRL